MLEIDGVPVERSASPESASELAAVLGEAHAAGLSLAAVGGGSKLHLGNPPRPVHLAVHTARIRGIVEYEPGNLTVSVRAGTTLEDLQQLLGAENQFLPLDPPHLDRATLGGLTACNSSGPIRFRYGTVRDMLLGIRVVLADGTQTKAGGKLVKNVTGYDMCKLYAGSLGTLGVITELTFKVQPKSEALATVSLTCPSLRAAFEAAQALLRDDLAPDAIEVLNDCAFAVLTGDAHGMPWVLLVRFGEADAAVRWQVDRMRKIAADAGAAVSGVLDARESGAIWRQMASLRAGPATGGVLLLKCPVLHNSAVETGRRLQEMGARLSARTLIFCHAGNHILYGRYEWPDGICDPGSVRREILALRGQCLAEGGHAVVEMAPLDVKRGLDVWGYQAPALDLMRRIKSQFDPKGLLNPGRYVGGI
jgi:glycolate oxidase FAD binding subunit